MRGGGGVKPGLGTACHSPHSPPPQLPPPLLRLAQQPQHAVHDGVLLLVVPGRGGQGVAVGALKPDRVAWHPSFPSPRGHGGKRPRKESNQQETRQRGSVCEQQGHAGKRGARTGAPWMGSQGWWAGAWRKS
jgi:hypothetical protein